MQEIDPLISRETAVAIAWQGLTKTKTIEDGVVVNVETEAWTKLSKEKKSEINSAYINYISTAARDCID